MTKPTSKSHYVPMALDMSGSLLDHNVTFSSEDLCLYANITQHTLIEFVEYGVVEILDGDQPRHWIFSSTALPRLRAAIRLQNELSLNPAAVSLALELLDEVHSLRNRLT